MSVSNERTYYFDTLANEPWSRNLQPARDEFSYNFGIEGHRFEAWKEAVWTTHTLERFAIGVAHSVFLVAIDVFATIRAVWQCAKSERNSHGFKNLTMCVLNIGVDILYFGSSFPGILFPFLQEGALDLHFGDEKLPLFKPDVIAGDEDEDVYPALVV